MLKQKLSDTEFVALNDVLKAEYTKKDDGSYYLETDEAKELVNALQRLKEANKGNEEMVASINAQLREAKEEAARKSGDIVAIENSWKAKSKAQKEADEAEKKQLMQVAKEGYINSLLSNIVGKFALPEKHVRRDFEERIEVVFENGRPVHRILDKDGKVSALTIDDLEKEFVADTNYSKYIIASKASGSAGTPPRRPGDSSSPKLYHEMTVAEQAVYLKNKHKHLQG
jgi:hypothetical protein